MRSRILLPPPSYNMARVERGVIACAHAVSRELGTGRPLKEYEDLLARRLQEMTLKFARQYPFGVPFDGPPVRGFYADFVVEAWVLLEVKAVDVLTAEHMAEARGYLRESRCRVCLLINFGGPEVEIERLLPDDEVNHAE